MESIKKLATILINKVGGTARGEAYKYRVDLPTPLMKAWGISKDNRKVNLEYDSEKIVITPVNNNKKNL